MKVFAILTTSLLLVGGGAGTYMYIHCPSRCGGGSSDAVIQQEVPPCCPSEAAVSAPAALPLAASPAPTTSAAKDCPVTADCNGPGCDEPAAAAAKKDECCDAPPDGCCPDEKAAKIEK